MSDGENEESEKATPPRNRKHDIETMRQLHSDAQRVLDEEIKTLTDLSRKAIRLAQVNGLALTILVAVASQVNTRTFINPISVMSMILLFVSASLSVWAYSIREVEIGIGPGVIETTLEEKPNEKEYLNWILTGIYKESMDRTKTKIDKKSFRLKWSIRSFLLGISLLSIGILYGMYSNGLL